MQVQNKMKRLYPSQVIEIIDSVYPQTKSFNSSPNQWPLSYADIPRISPIVDAVKSIPDELITLSGQDFVRVFATICADNAKLCPEIDRFFTFREGRHRRYANLSGSYVSQEPLTSSLTPYLPKAKAKR